MNARSMALLCWAFIFAVAGLPAGSDTGGGSGKPVTPYAGNADPTEADVRAVYDKAAQTMAVQGVPVAGSHASRWGYLVGFAFVSDKAPPKPEFVLRGTDESGKEQVISLASIASIRFTANDQPLEVVVFPALSPGELVARKPTYSVLVDQNTKVMKLKVNLKSAASAAALVGTDFYNETDYRVVFRFDELAPDTTIDFEPWPEGGVGFWWAIPSVTADPAYPHRRVMKK